MTEGNSPSFRLPSQAPSPAPAVSVIVTSYNQAGSLRFLLASLERQTYKNFEIVIADDGSSDETESLCLESWACPIIFATQADEGYRKSKIVNEAVRRAKGEYLVFLDGDVILEKHFLEDHLFLRKPNSYVCGRRVDLGPHISQGITVQDVKRGNLDRVSLALVLSSLKKDTIGLKRGLRISYPWLRRILGYTRPLDLLGSNFSVWKSDFFAVNGLNEAQESYWGEDGDLYLRLRNSGRKAIGAKSLCVQYHVFHGRRAPAAENIQRYHEALQDRHYVWAEKGISSRS